MKKLIDRFFVPSRKDSEFRKACHFFEDHGFEMIYVSPFAVDASDGEPIKNPFLRTNWLYETKAGRYITQILINKVVNGRYINRFQTECLQPGSLYPGSAMQLGHVVTTSLQNGWMLTMRLIENQEACQHIVEQSSKTFISLEKALLFAIGITKGYRRY